MTKSRSSNITPAIEIRSAAMTWAYHDPTLTAAAATLHPLVRRYGAEVFAREAGIALGAWSAHPWPHHAGDVLAAALILRACPTMDHEMLARYVDEGRRNALAPAH